MLNRQQYNTVKHEVEQYDQAANAWMNANKTNGLPVEVCKTFPFANLVNNDLRSEIEVYEFVNDVPEKYFLYINEERKEATTWTGQRLGYVNFGREYRDNFGGKRVPITVNAINGRKYHGTYYKSAGDYARVKIAKS